MDTAHPHTAGDVTDLLAAASRDHTRVLPVGGRRHLDRGNPCEVDLELWTTQLDGVAAYEPSDMIAVIGAGTRVHDLQMILAEGGQEWPVDAPGDATVGGVIAAGVSSPRRLRVGSVRDSLLEAEFVTGDGRHIHAGARTVKQSTGYGITRLLVGSLGTLGVLTQVALKVRPLPKATCSLVTQEGGLALARRLQDGVPLASAVVAEAERVVVRLEGWPDEIEEQTRAARTVADAVDHDEPFPTEPFPDAPILAEVSVAPSALDRVVADRGRWRALLGVGTAWLPLDELHELEALRRLVTTLGGTAPVARGPGGLGAVTLPAPEVQRRLKEAFDPAAILVPERWWQDPGRGVSAGD